MTGDELAALLLYLAERWPNFKLPATQQLLDVRLAVWRDVIGDLDPTEVRAAVVSLGAREFAPDPGMVRNAVFELRGSGPPSVDEAMAEVFAAISAHGWTETPVWSHPAIGAAVAAVGGWLEVCRSDNAEALRAHLARFYGTASASAARVDQMPPAVAGLLASIGRSVDEVLAIGEGGT